MWNIYDDDMSGFSFHHFTNSLESCVNHSPGYLCFELWLWTLKLPALMLCIGHCVKVTIEWFDRYEIQPCFLIVFGIVSCTLYTHLHFCHLLDTKSKKEILLLTNYTWTNFAWRTRISRIECLLMRTQQIGSWSSNSSMKCCFMFWPTKG